MSKKTFILILLVGLGFSIFTVNISPSKSLAQNNKKGIINKIGNSYGTFRKKVLDASDKMAKEYKKITPKNKNVASSKKPPANNQNTPPQNNPSTPLTFIPPNENPPTNDEYRDGLQIVALYEGAYINAVGESINPFLKRDNFEYQDDTNITIKTIFDSVSQRYKDLPPHEWPIIVIPTPSFQTVNNMIINEYPEPNGLNVVMPYKTPLGGTFPNTYNTTGNFKVTLVGGGHELNDWSKGNKLDFIDSVDIQYLDPEPKTNYDISSITTSGTTTRIYNPTLPYHVRIGWVVWLNLTGTTGNILQRYTITQISVSNGYVTVNKAIDVGTFISGKAHVNYLSGTVAVVAAKLKQIMNALECSFPQALEFARATASNEGTRNDEVGYGKINVASAILYGRKRMSPTSGE